MMSFSPPTQFELVSVPWILITECSVFSCIFWVFFFFLKRIERVSTVFPYRSRDLTSLIFDAKIAMEDGKSQGEKLPFWRYCLQELYMPVFGSGHDAKNSPMFLKVWMLYKILLFP